MTTPSYPVAMAVEDFVPTLLAFGGFWLLAGLRSLAGTALLWLGRVGAVLIGLGGVAKSVWKLLVAGWQIDLPWLEGLLFPLMSVGAVLLLTSLLRSYWVLLALALAAWQPFIVATAGVTLISVTGIVLAVRRKLWAAAALFTLGIAAVMALVPLRGHPKHETVTFQWIEQSTNTAAQLCFFVAAWLLARRFAHSSTGESA
ncbi:hypothetical protein Rhe02_04810 [Rhizocola hellebori]|uniref:Transmembrane protein n=1 Tax=Rhizocola hellebori TaxID=1392758 RepID=A0A8J3Q2E7_9ACTN|nr:hypothetical protein [Rhizocola hellebori]GIH02414.1 hypothetical protein Rhe02_04810 [Rhizocola hellebori]